MKTNPIIRTVVIFIILTTNIGCDQVSKSIVRRSVDYDEQISLINNHFTLTKIENTGAFLSLGTSLPQPFKSLLLTIVPIVALSMALVFLFAKKSLPPITILGICFIIGGGIGNLYDRIVYGSVTDFLHINFGIFQTGIFNMADVSIMTGMFMILLYRLFTKVPLSLKPLDTQKPEKE